MTPDEMALSLQLLMVTNGLTALMVTFLSRKVVRVLRQLEQVTGSVGGEETSAASPSALRLMEKQDPVPKEPPPSEAYVCLYNAMKASRNMDVLRAVSWEVKDVPRHAFQAVLEHLHPNLHGYAWHLYEQRAVIEGSTAGSRVNRYSAL